MRLSVYLVVLGAVSGLPDDHDSHGNGDNAAAEVGSTMDMAPSPMSMDHMHGRPVLENPHLEPQQRKYWEQYNTTTFFSVEQGNKFNLWSHAILATVAFGMLAPVTILLSMDSRTQWLYVPLQTVQSVCAVLSLLSLAIYSATAPHLYPGNAYSGFSIAMFALVVVHWVAMILRAITSYLSAEENGSYSLAGSYHADEENDLANEYILEDMSEQSHESGSSTEFSSDTDASSFDGQQKALAAKITPESSGLVKKLARTPFFTKFNRALGGFANALFNLLNIPLLFVGFAYLLTGLGTAFCMGKGRYVFALLAHWIKGFVFFALGFLELARFFGAGSRRGWAWNELTVRNSDSPRLKSWTQKLKFWPDHPTAEFWQSFAIFFYGSTNVFLEHLGNTDGKWSHKDLQHASIAFMFFGGGLCGLILESETIKNQLKAAFGIEGHTGGGRMGWSLNPMPAFIIFWTGALMSHHEQETELSTAIHVQWGTLFSLAAVLRLCTLALLCARPRPKSAAEAAMPQRPFTEVLVTFCLICGGLVFMSSNRESVEGMIYRGMDQMFSLNVSVGVTVIFMAYFTGCLAIKGWAASRY